MPRWIQWLWRNNTEPVAGRCRICDARLTLCATCHGDWQVDACHDCQLGFTCPIHHDNWI